MAPKVTVLKVCITCDKCRAKLLKAIAGLEGVNKIETDEEKSTLTVAGPVDPYDVVACARKVCFAKIQSVGDPKKPEPKREPKPEKETKPETCCSNPCYCRMCCPDYVVLPFDTPPPYGPYQEPGPCAIM